VRKAGLRSAALLGIVLMLVPATLRAAKPHTKAPANQPPVSPQEVHVGGYVMHIHEINIKDNYFIADFYLWFRWSGDELKPYKTFTLVDAREELKSDPDVTRLPDGSNYAYVRIVAKVTKFWDLRGYPLDSHDLDINVEEEANEETSLHYVADTDNSGADQRQISMPGWRMVQTFATNGVGVYRSNFGDTSLPQNQETRYSRFTLRMTFARKGDLVFLKLLFGVWVGAGISFVAFFIKPRRIDPRFGVGVGAIFAAIASEYIVTQSLPDTNAVSLADKLHVVAFAFIFLSIVESTCSLYLAERGHEVKSNRMDRRCRWIFPVSFAVLNGIIIAVR
jgi:hypothetical protein